MQIPERRAAQPHTHPNPLHLVSVTLGCTHTQPAGPSALSPGPCPGLLPTPPWPEGAALSSSDSTIPALGFSRTGHWGWAAAGARSPPRAPRQPAGALPHSPPYPRPGPLSSVPQTLQHTDPHPDHHMCVTAAQTKACCCPGDGTRDDRLLRKGRPSWRRPFTNAPDKLPWKAHR